MSTVPLAGRPMVIPARLRIFTQVSGRLPVTRCLPSGTIIMTSTPPRRRIQSRRTIQYSSNRSAPPSESSSFDAASVTSFNRINTTTAAAAVNMPATIPNHVPLSILPLSTVIRTLATTTISSSPALLPPSLRIMSVLAHTKNPILNPDKNPILRYLLKKTFYAQFCAGENAAEVRNTISGLKKMGFKGVILGYAREVVLTEAQTKNLGACEEGAVAEECIRNEITPWKKGTMATVELAQPGDFVSLKFSGAGRQALYALKNRLPPSPALKAAIDEVCELAAKRNVPLLFDAEQTAVQPGIDGWTLAYQRRFNRVPGHAIIYGTYQAYLKSAPATVAKHLAEASKDGFTLGVKLVRGAYLGSDPRHVIHDTKQDTDNCYDGIAEALIRRQWSQALPQPEQGVEFPKVSVVCGSHNLESVCKARDIRNSIPAGEGCSELAIAQLQGMADEVSCEMVCKKDMSAEKKKEKEAQVAAAAAELTRAYKYLVWGTTGECMAYLLRRAHENKDAVQRTRDGRNAMANEVMRRFWGLFGRR